MASTLLRISETMGLVLLPSGGCAAPQPVAQGKKYVILVGHGGDPFSLLAEWTLPR